MVFGSYYKVGGSLKAGHSSYVVRKADSEIFDSLKAGEYCFVFNSRQMGKSSLRVQTLKKLEAKGIKCAAIDVTIIGTHVSQEKWYKGFASLLLSKLEINQIDFNSWWNQNHELTEIQRLNQLIETVLLKQILTKIVIFVDEIDSLLNSEFKDDFFAFIRACYNQKAEQVEYNRITFCLLGVVTPGDLIQERGRTPFNIGKSIELTGFSFEEAKNALLPGLEGKVEYPEVALQEVLDWTGGQPFLTQKLCNLVVQQTESSKPNINELVQKYIIQNWETQDEPEHLRSIRDRLLWDEQKTVRLLGLYQQVLNHTSSESGVAIDGSDVQTELRLSGLVVKKDGRLKAYNPIYQAVFNQDWLQRELDKLRPYSEAINSWSNANYASHYLLHGEALYDALEWAAGKSLSNWDYKFLQESQKLETEAQIKANQKLSEDNHKLAEANQKAQQKLVATELEAQQKLAQANSKAKKIVWRGGSVALILILISGVLGIIIAKNELNTLTKATRITQDANNAEQQFQSKQLDALHLAMTAGENLQELVKNKHSLSEYPTTAPLSALLNILVNVRESNQFYSDKTINSLGFSPDGKVIISAIDEKTKTVNLLDQNGSIITTLKPQNSVKSTSFSPDSKIIAAASYDGTVRFWKRDGTPIEPAFIDKRRQVTSFTFSPNGKIIAFTTEEGTIEVCKRDRPECQTLPDRGGVTSVSFSPNGEIIASGSRDQTIKLWKKNGSKWNQNPTTLAGHSSSVTSISFSPDSKIIASGSEDKTIKIWKEDGTLISTLNGHSEPVTSLSFSPDGNTFASSSDGTIKLWKLNVALRNKFIKHKDKDWVESVSFSPDGTIASASDSTVKLWAANGASNNILLSHNDWVTSVRFGPDSTIASASSDRNVKLWTPDGVLKKTLAGKDLVTSLSFSPNGKIVALGNDNGTTKLWQPDENSLAVLPGQQEGWVESVIFSPDGKIVASGGSDGTIKLWKLNGTLNATLDATLAGPAGSRQGVNSISFSPDGKIIASASKDQTITLWKWDGSKWARNSNTLNRHSGSVTSISFSPNGEIIASGSEDKTIKLWWQDGTAIATLTGHDDSVINLSFISDQMLTSVSKDGRAIRWSLNLNDLLAEGCTWLKDYFDTHPNPNFKRLKVCSPK